MSAAYLDTSAVVKLLVREPETDALLAALAERPTRTSSALLAVEATCVARRRGLDADLVDELVAGVLLLPLGPAVLDGARAAFRPAQRALDAIHLATAVLARDALGAFVTYDADQAAAAHDLGLPVLAPR